MTRYEWAVTVAVVVPCLVIAAALARMLWRSARSAVAWERQAQKQIAALEPVDDPCAVEGCGHARGEHYHRADRSRGACLHFECDCANYQPDRPGQKPTVYDYAGEPLSVEGR